MLPLLRITARFQRLVTKENTYSKDVVLNLTKRLSTLSREIHMTYGDNKRMVPVTTNDGASLRESFIRTFHDVIPPSARKFQFQRYQEDIDDFIDIAEGESIEHVHKSRAFVIISLAVERNKVYKIWSLASNVGNGYLSRRGNIAVTSGSGDSKHCEWLVMEGKQTPSVNYYRFLSKDKTQTLCVNSNKEIQIKKPSEVPADYSDNFVPDPLPGSNLYAVLKPYTTQKDHLFIGSDGHGKVKLVEMGDPEYNPTAEALFVIHRVGK